MGKRSFENVVEDILLELAVLGDVFSVNDLASKTGINYRTVQRALNLIYKITSSGILQKVRRGGKDLWVWRPRRSYIEAKAMIILQELFEKEKVSIKEIADKYGWDSEVVEEAIDYLIRKSLAKREEDYIIAAEPWRYLKDYVNIRKKILKELRKDRNIVILRPINIDMEYVVISNGKLVGIVYTPIATRRSVEKIEEKAKKAEIDKIIIVADETEIESENIVLINNINKLREKIAETTKMLLPAYAPKKGTKIAKQILEQLRKEDIL